MQSDDGDTGITRAFMAALVRTAKGMVSSVGMIKLSGVDCAKRRSCGWPCRDVVESIAHSETGRLPQRSGQVRHLFQGEADGFDGEVAAGWYRLKVTAR